MKTSRRPAVRVGMVGLAAAVAVGLSLVGHNALALPNDDAPGDPPPPRPPQPNATMTASLGLATPFGSQTRIVVTADAENDGPTDVPASIGYQISLTIPNVSGVEILGWRAAGETDFRDCENSGGTSCVAVRPGRLAVFGIQTTTFLLRVPADRDTLVGTASVYSAADRNNADNPAETETLRWW